MKRKFLNIRMGSTWLLILLLVVQPVISAFPRVGAEKVARNTNTAPGNSPEPAQVQSNVDLTITALDVSSVVTDSQTLAISGELGVTVNNLGSVASSSQFRVIAFEDSNGNGIFNSGLDPLLGSIYFTDIIAPNSKTNLNIGLSGAVAFKGNLIYVFVDSENVIAEIEENNNIKKSSITTDASVLMYSNDFEGAIGSEWSSQPTSITPSGRRFLGEYNNQSTRLLLNNLPSHTSLKVSFDLYIIRSWDGNGNNSCCPGPDVWNFNIVGGPVLLNTTFSNSSPQSIIRQAYPGGYPGSEYLARTGASENNSLGYIYIDGAGNNGGPSDTVYKLSYTFSHTAGAIELEFSASGLQEGVTVTGIDEVWGLDNIRVEEPRLLETPDLTASLIRSNANTFPASSELTARIGNGGGAPAPPNAKVSFFRGDPASGGALIGTTQTSIPLSPGQYEDVKVVWTSPPTGLHPITVVADDDGNGLGTVAEGSESNNKAMANIAFGIGPFTLVDDLIARFKDGVVDLQWSPVTGASGYNIYRRTGNDSPQLIKQNHPRTNYSDPGRANGVTNFYSIRWLDSGGNESGQGTEMSGTPTTRLDRTVRDVPPTIISKPVVSGVTGQPYGYQPQALDPDPADTKSWSLITPPAGMTIDSTTGAIQWTPTLAQPGYHDIVVRVEDSRGRFALQTYRLFVEIPNHPPVVNAGSDQTVILASGAALNGSVLDDGLPFGGTLTTSWTRVSGPGTVVFSDPGTPATTAAFSAPGSYVLRLTAGDSQSTSNDEVSVYVVNQLASRIYTLNSDFDEGSYSNVEDRIPHQLQLAPGIPLSATTPLNPVVLWRKDSFNVRPGSNNVRMTPAVIDLNGDQIPDIIFYTYGDGEKLRAISGADGSELWAVDDPAYDVVLDAGVAVGDIDNDGRPEIVAMRRSTESLIAFEHDGTFKWSATVPIVNTCSIADIDNDGSPEIVCGATVFNNNGSLRWQASIGPGLFGNAYSVVSDLNMDGDLEVIAGGNAYRSDGTLFWSSGAGDGMAAVGNFDSDPFPEVTLVRRDNSSLYMIEHNGQIKWGPINIPTGRGGNPVIADVDGDGLPEIGVAAALAYILYRADGTIKWQTPIIDGSSANCSSTIFDLNGDGTAEVIYGDEQYLRIFRGSDGVEIYSLPKSSATGAEYPVVADVNADGRAEIIAVAEGTQRGIIVLGGFDNNWVNTRRIWNQFAYHVTNINDDGTIPRFEQPNWLTPGLNNFRVNASPIVNTGFWTVVFDSQITGAEWGRINWNAKICNDGAITVTAASSNDNINFSDAQPVTRGADLTVPDGRYLKINVLFRRASTGESPILYDLSVGTDGYQPPVVANTPPVVDAGASQLIALPNPARLRPSVCDDSLPVSGALASTWSKISGPGSVTFSNANALVTDAIFSAAGTYVLRLTVSDGQLSTGDDITIEVENDNRPPVIASQPVTEGYVGKPYRYQVLATDPNAGDILSYTLPTAPAGMAINATTGLIQWAPALADVGVHNVRIVVTDLLGAQAEQIFTVTVTDPPPNRPPVIASTAPIAASAGAQYTYAVIASDEDTADVLTYSLDAAPAGMSINGATGLIQWTPTSAQQGAQSVTVRVRDLAGLFATQSFSINVGPFDNTPPVVSLSSPAAGITLTSDVPVIGSVSDANLVGWTLEYKLFSGNAWVTLATGNTQITDAVLSTFPATLLADNSYLLRLRAEDVNHEVETFREVIVNTKDLKLGPFTWGYEDLRLPGVGMPIIIRRFYDSRRTEPGDFGPGWTLGFNNVDIRTDAGKNVFITLPNGRRTAFALAPSRIGFFPLYRNQYIPATGVYDTLENTDCGYLYNSNGQWFCDDFSPYQPRNFILRTKEGLTFTISDNGGIKKIEDRNGRYIAITSDGITNNAGRNVVFTRNARGQITNISDPNGNSLKYEYDELGRLVKFTDQLNLTTTYVYQGNTSFMTEIRTPGNCRPLKTEYGPDGRVIAKEDNGGNRTTYAYDQVNRTETVTDSLGQTTIHKYDVNGNLIEVQDPLNSLTIYTYDVNNNNLSVTFPSGRTITQTFDSRGNILTRTESPQTGTNLITNYSYTQLDYIDTVTKPLGDKIKFSYDAKGNLLRREYVAADNTVVSADSFTYDTMGNQLTWTDGEGKVTQYTYDAFGEVASRRDPTAVTTSYEYDGNGNPSAFIDGAGNRTEFIYNGFNLLGQTKHGGQTISSITYNELNKPLTVTDALGRTITYGYDCQGNLTQVTDPAGNVTMYQVDALANLKKVTDARGNHTNYLYDAANRQTARTGPDNQTWGTGYTPDGYIQSTTSPNGATIQTQYDSMGRITLETRPEKTIEYTYADCCRQSQVIERIGAVIRTTSYTYDGIGRLSSVTDPNNRTISYTYNGRSQRASMTTPDGTVTIYAYDDAGRVSEIRTNLDWARFSYDAAGRRTRVLYSNGASNNYSYNTRGMLTSVIIRDGADAVIASYDYTLDVNGNRTGITYHDGFAIYTLDSLDRLTSETVNSTSLGNFSKTYSYDAVGNRLDAGASFSPDNRLISDGGGAYSYNSNGNLITRGDQNFGYDSTNRLVSYNKPGVMAIYQYDYLGRRRAKIVNGATTEYLYDEGHSVAEYLETTQVARYTYGSSVDEVLMVIRNGQPFFYHQDGLGSIVAITNGAGQVAQRYGYDAWGNIQLNSGSFAFSGPGPVNTFTYTGREYDSESLRYHYRSRAYDPATGRFLRKDTRQGNLINPVSQHPYLYANNNPVSHTDPTGETVLFGYQLLLNSNYNDVAASVIGSIVGYGITNLLFLGHFLDSKGSLSDQDKWQAAIDATDSSLKKYPFSRPFQASPRISDSCVPSATFQAELPGVINSFYSGVGDSLTIGVLPAGTSAIYVANYYGSKLGTAYGKFLFDTAVGIAAKGGNIIEAQFSLSFGGFNCGSGFALDHLKSMRPQ